MAIRGQVRVVAEEEEDNYENEEAKQLGYGTNAKAAAAVDNLLPTPMYYRRGAQTLPAHLFFLPLLHDVIAIEPKPHVGI